MRHLRRVTVVKELTTRDAWRDSSRTGPEVADAKTDFMNAVWRAWSDYVDAKKNEYGVFPS